MSKDKGARHRHAGAVPDGARQHRRQGHGARHRCRRLSDKAVFVRRALGETARHDAQKYGEKTGIISVGDLTVDTAARRVERAGREISLSAKEYELLQYLVMNKGVVLSREKIEDHIWNYDYEGGTNVVDVYIRYLRKKIDEGEDIKLIHTVRGAGYVIK